MKYVLIGLLISWTLLLVAPEEAAQSEAITPGDAVKSEDNLPPADAEKSEKSPSGDTTKSDTQEKSEINKKEELTAERKDDKKLNGTESPKNKTKKLIKPSFIPYCVTRDVCKPVCDCAMFSNCELLDMNADVRNRILIALNQARSIQTKGEPQASGMPKLIYDKELEEISKCWAARCENEYSECFRTPYFDETTQTVHLLPLDLKVSELPLDYWDRTIQIWLGEVSKTTAEVVSSLPAGKRGEDVHSYAQILSDRILRVGCAWSRLVSVEQSVIFVCTFAPRGPRQGEPIYKSGKACTTCSEGYKCDYREPFEFLCKQTSMATQRDVEERAEMESNEGRNEDSFAEPMEDYNSNMYIDNLDQKPRKVEEPIPRAAQSSASLFIGAESFPVGIILCLIKFIR